MTTFDTKLPNRADTKKPDLGLLVSAFTLNSDALGWALSKCLDAVGSDPGRPALEGLHIGCDTLGTHKGIRIVATDGVKLRRCNLPEAAAADKTQIDAFNAILAARGAAAVLAAIYETDPAENITVRLHAKTVAFETKGWTLYTRPLNAQYPNTLAVMPSAKDVKHTALIDAERAIKTVQLTSSIATLKVITRITLGADKLTLYVKGTRGHREESVAAKVKGGPFAVAIEGRRLFDALRALERVEEDGVTVVAGTAEIGFQAEPGKPLLIRDPQEPDFIQVLMPELQTPSQPVVASQKKTPGKPNEQGSGKQAPTPGKGPLGSPSLGRPDPGHKPLTPGKPHPKPSTKKAPPAQKPEPLTSKPSSRSDAAHREAVPEAARVSA